MRKAVLSLVFAMVIGLGFSSPLPKTPTPTSEAPMPFCRVITPNCPF